MSIPSMHQNAVHLADKLRCTMNSTTQVQTHLPGCIQCRLMPEH